ncbi:hypothetical protein BJV82DRAFT_654206 [Fennellomyces sp. T-0311]|nr:hypothetical protein BJV82DRAFT_654206 [Fennellomyces sp. T-0311]
MRPLATLSLLCAAALCVQADGQSEQHIVKEAGDLVSTTGLRLIQTSEAEGGRFMNELEILKLIQKGTHFMDITDNQDPVMPARDDNKVPTGTFHQEEALGYIQNLTTEHMEEWLETFTSFRTRYYKSRWGAQSSEWLESKIEEVAAPAADRITVSKFKHQWDQYSIIARFEGSNEDLSNEAVIISAHQDSVNMWLPPFGRSPGADDDGSGTVTILETFRSLVEGGFAPERPVEFHWYSAEEGGLLGSQEVAKSYSSKGKEIVAMIQNDMTGYIGARGEVIGLVTDYVNEKLTEFMRKLIDTYADIPYVNTECGYACSDHASWRKYGYPSSFMIESAFDDSNHYIHTPGDTIDKLSFDHMLQFSKVLVGFAVEFSHPESDE